ncbi:uncharacterized protein A4U43_C03F22060 [Asparagus officinalis]|uniref:Uncharacterized protein n=1 Tax=Asparagus officinalis TaxID=4686 RepID=A0A5P1FGD3_ASPOF|nr:jasmonic acid-amido synthetase JAR1 isoform X2 [Asparagus officinalis]ONK75929.1 uncharacterized protein A4U43_C03F22060 [Asparagus officinalis]
MTVPAISGADTNLEDYDIVRWFEDIADNAAQVQTQILKRIVKLNCNTEYLRNRLGTEVLNIEELEPERIADGDDSALLTQEPITMLSLSSGTTDGRQKYVPFTRFSSQSTLQIFRLAAAYRSRVFPIRAGGRILEFVYSSKQFKTRGGLTAGTATTHYFASEEFKTKQKTTKSFTCSPYEVISAGDYKQSTYCHLLLGLLFADQVEFVTSTFAYSLVQAFTAFEDVWQEICEDIRHGTLSSRITITNMRSSVLDYIAPDPALALEIESKCKELNSSNWHCMIPRLWPNAKYVYSIMTGAMQPYLKKLRHYAGDLALVCADYGSTESWIGVNLGPLDPPERVNFTVVPTFSYFEFIPLSLIVNRGSEYSLANDDYEEGEPLPLSKVKIGEQYEVVLTTFTGLYRYRLGDVVEVAGFYKGAPQLNFICRRKLILTVNIDKNTEKDLQMVVEKGSNLLSQKTKSELVDFTSNADTSKNPGHYVVYWEIKGNVEDEVLNECCREMDLAFVDHGYVVSRKTNSIGPLELKIVETGTFRKILEYYIGNGAAMSQFKTPRCTSNQVLLRILGDRTIKQFRSTAYR